MKQIIIQSTIDKLIRDNNIDKLNELNITYFILHEADGYERWDNLSNQYYYTPYL